MPTMILRSFTQNSPLLPIIYPLVIVLIILSGHQELWMHCQNSSLGWMSPLWINTIFIVTLTFNALFINLVYNRSELYHSPVFLTGLIYSILASIATVQTGDFTVLAAQTFTLIALYFCFSIFRQKKIAHLLFLSSLFLGMATLLDEYYLIFVLLPFFLAIWNRPFSFKDITLVLAGYLTPMMYWNSWIWLTQSQNEMVNYWPYSISDNPLIYGAPTLAFVLTFIVVVLLAIISLNHKEDRQSNKTGQSKQYLVLLLLISIAGNVIQHFKGIQLGIHYVTSLALILIVSQYWTHYRTSLLAPFVFYISMVIAIIEFFHWF